MCKYERVSGKCLFISVHDMYKSDPSFIYDDWRDFSDWYGRKKQSLERSISGLEYNIDRINEKIDEYGDNDVILKKWNRELKILKLELWDLVENKS
jgi:hypothetical protein